MPAADLSWQTSLFGYVEPEPDVGFSTLQHYELDDAAWVDHVPGWLRGADVLFQELLDTAPWEETTQHIYDRTVATPRLVAHWPCEPRSAGLPPHLERIRAVLSDRYRKVFDSIGANLYRDGRDSVAWHGDRIARSIKDPLVATVSLGHARRFLMRPRGGTTQLTLTPHAGDLIMMGGSFQRTWQHTVPKATSAGPRISVTVRHSH